MSQIPYIEPKHVFRAGSDAAYQEWRSWKLAQYTENQAARVFIAKDTSSMDELSQNVTDQCARFNFAIYQFGDQDEAEDAESQQELRSRLIRFCRGLGLKEAEKHRSRGDDGIVSIQVETNSIGAGYIPYTTRRLTWHTDGYYNQPDKQIRGMVLHCVRNASSGGINELLDPDIVYIRLRDKNPELVEALFHPEAMTIPENTDPRSAFRPDSVGPVFSIGTDNGKLNMRYSARGRNIIWRDDEVTRTARALIKQILEDDPLIVRHQLQPGQGIISNNVLHNRTGFEDLPDIEGSGRLLYRLRFYDAVR